MPKALQLVRALLIGAAFGVLFWGAINLYITVRFEVSHSAVVRSIEKHADRLGFALADARKAGYKDDQIADYLLERYSDEMVTLSRLADIGAVMVAAVCVAVLVWRIRPETPADRGT